MLLVAATQGRGRLQVLERAGNACKTLPVSLLHVVFETCSVRRKGVFPSPSQCNNIGDNYRSIFKTYIDNEKPINKNRTDFKTLSTNVPHLNKHSNDDLTYLGRIVKLYFEELRNTFIVKKMDELINEKNEIIERLNILSEREGQLMDEFMKTNKKTG